MIGEWSERMLLSRRLHNARKTRCVEELKGIGLTCPGSQILGRHDQRSDQPLRVCGGSYQEQDLTMEKSYGFDLRF